MYKVNNRNTRTRCEIVPMCQLRHSGVFKINFEHISHLVLVFLLLTLNVRKSFYKSLLNLAYL